ncbi:B3 domain-containing protein Os01g0234100-like [Juglans regia]|uniref:B3 domain-containing protein Os01g0234100-like n=2 Tax=Juglans regia TaxID=51240 RepID=A0A2I4DS43_JUGRE|nr:B3 domain-containing protein Os01g0234100-like [Juglans regia]
MDPEVWREGKEEKEGNAKHDTAEEMLLISTELDDVTLAELSKTPKSKRISWHSSCTGENRKAMDNKKERLSNIKKGNPESKIKHATSNQAAEKAILSSKQGKTLMDGRAVIRAEEIRSNLPPEYPSFVKSLVRSHVASCFWMGLPLAFCKAHLPDKDTPVILEDECGKQHELKYIAVKTGLSSGWRQFSVAHKLLEGDVLVFQLVEPTKFKVYIIRPNDLNEVDGTLGLLNLNSQTKLSGAGMGKATSSNPKRKLPKCLPIGIDDMKKKSGLPKSVPYLRQLAEQSQNDSTEEVVSEVMEDFKLSERVLKFEDIKSFLNFRILVDGMSIDSEFPDDIRKKYYKLCCSQNAFLHDRLVKGINYKLVAGIISETVNIAYAIKASNLTTSQGEFSTWDKTLLGFEHLGMDVKFLRSRLHSIASLANESESESYTRSYLEVRTERGSIENEMRNIEVKLSELKEACYGFGAYIDNMKSKAEIYELNLQGEVTAPW